VVDPRQTQWAKWLHRDPAAFHGSAQHTLSVVGSLARSRPPGNAAKKRAAEAALFVTCVAP